MAGGAVDEYVVARTPVLIERGAAGWMRWTPERLVELMGDEECTVVRDDRPALATERRSLRSYFADPSLPSTFTLTKVDQHSGRPAPYVSDLPLPNPLFRVEDVKSSFLYHARPGVGVAPHVHLDAFNILASGRKRWAMWDADRDVAPAGWEALKESLADYDMGISTSQWFARRIEPLRRRGLAIVEFHQGPEDVVYVPRNWAHTVLNVEESLGSVVLVDRQRSSTSGGGAARTAGSTSK